MICFHDGILTVRTKNGLKKAVGMETFGGMGKLEVGSRKLEVGSWKAPAFAEATAGRGNLP